jgi:recombination protein RecT
MSNQVAVKTKDVRDLLQSERILDQVRLALPAHMTPDRMVRVMCTAMLRNPKLLDCRQESLVEALMICSQAGIEPDGRNAHLIPYGDKVQVIFDYKGLVAIAERNGVESIYADRVCENDQFDAWVEEGAKKLKHRVDWKKPRGNAYAYYASCIRGNRLDYEVMTKDEVDAIRKRSRASGSGPWVTDYDEMAKKTVLRRMSKRWDLSPEARDAITADDDTPAFEVSSTIVKQPTFDDFPGVPQLSAPPASKPTTKKRTMHPPAHDTTQPVPQPVEVQAEPVAETDELSFEQVVDANTDESPEIVTLKAALATAGIEEAKALQWCVNRQLVPTGADVALASIPKDKLTKLAGIITKGGPVVEEMKKL